MHKFEKNQVVVAFYGRDVNKRLVLYVDEGNDFEGGHVFFCKDPGEPDKKAIAYYKIVPLSFFEPDAFI